MHFTVDKLTVHTVHPWVRSEWKETAWKTCLQPCGKCWVGTDQIPDTKIFTLQINLATDTIWKHLLTANTVFQDPHPQHLSLFSPFFSEIVTLSPNQDMAHFSASGKDPSNTFPDGQNSVAALALWQWHAYKPIPSSFYNVSQYQLLKKECSPCQCQWPPQLE